MYDLSRLAGRWKEEDQAVIVTHIVSAQGLMLATGQLYIKPFWHTVDTLVLKSVNKSDLVSLLAYREIRTFPGEDGFIVFIPR